MNSLEKILQHKRLEIEAAKTTLPISALQDLLEQAPPVRNFRNALQHRLQRQHTAIIAEIKKASPSKGLIREDFQPALHARQYEQGGATCLSVLTDSQFFQGSSEYLQLAHAACKLPVLRKDFMLDEYQILESRVMGSDCILLIVAAVDDETLLKLEQTALQLGMSVLIEVHDEAELDRALRLSSPLIGINNRNLKTFKTDIQTTVRLAAAVPENRMVVSESGISTREDIELLKQEGVHGFLIGESLMRQPDPGQALRTLLA